MHQSYPPLTKQIFVDVALDSLYKRLLSTMDNKLKNIINHNSQLFNNNQQAFIHNNSIYSTKDAVHHRGINRLHPKLIPSMMEYLDEWKFIFAYEQPMIKGFLSKVVNNYNNIVDFKEILPNKLHPVIVEIFTTDEKEETDTVAHTVAEFKQKNSSKLDLIHCRIVSDLLI